MSGANPPASNSRQGFGRGGNNKNQPPKSPAQAPQAPQAGAIPNSQSLTNSLTMDNLVANDPDAPKYFFQEKYAPLNVRGNFLTLCACPKNVELGEWLAHQIVEQYRLLHGMLQVIQETNSVTSLPICNESTCPTMSAGRLTYTWLVDGRAAKISAPKFINRVEKWIVSKIHDPVMFPTEKVNGVPETASMRDANSAAAPSATSTDSANPAASSGASADEWIGQSSGFPQTFYKDCQGIMKQMFRCYAHLYHAHWLNPFWHLNKHDILNMCFVHFVTVAKYYQLVSDKEMEPMQPLIDLFIKQQRVPPEALNGGHWAQQPTAN
ncbi:CBK1 kinase activator protein MOB2 [Penicillium rolfsii]|nr:CBK1 kinase activator protein MOB2 [Penicillium rolfsii]